MEKRIGTLLLATLFAVFGSAQYDRFTQRDLKKVAAAMSGDYSNTEQAKADSTYFHITLRMKPIWNGSRDGYWLYVEQALESAQEKPYRQRVYHVYLQDDSTIVSKVYEIRHPENYILGWKDPSKLAGLTKDSLIDRQGCGIFLRRKDGRLAGSTPGKKCLSSLRGAAYATSEVVITKKSILSWDRGWNSEDEQVWGAVKGGYLFIKKKKLR
jgi:hypothetical protein